MSFFSNLFRRAEPQKDALSAISLLDKQHRELAVSIFELVRAGAVGNDELPNYAKMIAGLLKRQAAPAGSVPFVNASGRVNAKAAGYVYGASDAALQIASHDMADEAVGVPFLFNVFTELAPANLEPCMEFVISGIGHDNKLMSGIELGGQEFLAVYKSNGAARMPVTLAKLLLA